MNTKLFVLAAAMVCGLAPEDAARRIMANVLFGFESNAVKMAILCRASTVRSCRRPGRVNALEFRRYNDVYFLSAAKVALGEYTVQISGPKTFIAIQHADTGIALFVANADGNGNRLAGDQIHFWPTRKQVETTLVIAAR